ncbi:unnamed protein product [Bacillus thuringiensis DB27]|uniref:Uncharacterized protein n=1 Tax=Bacillus thuringiensis DB27 TaxID=1431339 RepID=W8YE34_BACTU|nr:unnamed protein product [Bacillus thuringiensis DB27]
MDTYGRYFILLAVPQNGLFWGRQPARKPLKDFEGLGSSIEGVKGKSSPCRFGQSPRCFAMLGMARRSR